MSQLPILDAKGLHCPLPVLKAKQRLQQLKSGEQLLILATDQGALNDFKVFCRKHCHQLLQINLQAGELQFLIQKGE